MYRRLNTAYCLAIVANTIAVSKTMPTLQVVYNPMLRANSPLQTVDVTTGDNPIATGQIKGETFVVKPFAVTVIKMKQ